MTIYLLKIQGTHKIPDYIQIRDKDFTLIAYFRMNNPKRALTVCNLLNKMEEILRVAEKLTYGKMQKLEFENF